MIRLKIALEIRHDEVMRVCAAEDKTARCCCCIKDIPLTFKNHVSGVVCGVVIFEDRLVELLSL